MLWSERRRFLYMMVTAILLVTCAFLVWYIFFKVTPTCSDSIQNADEHGVDCGGICTLVCKSESRPPMVLWSRLFMNDEHTYTAIAYTQNQNFGIGAHNVGYTFHLFDADNRLVIEQRGVTDIPPMTTVPIVVTNIDVGNRIPTHALFAFSEDPVWHKVAKKDIIPLSLKNQNFATDGSRLSVVVTNDLFKDAPQFAVIAVLFDGQGVARATSKSIISSLARKSSQDVVFTWSGGIPDIVRVEVTILPSF